MLQASASALFPALAAIALKSAAVLTLARLLTLALRSLSAAARHLVWTAAAAAVLALPFLSQSLPAVRVSGPAAALAADTGLVFRILGVDAAASPAPVSPISAPARATPPRARFDFRAWLVFGWAAGVAVSSLQMLFAYAAVWRLRRASQPVTDPNLVLLSGTVPVHAVASGSMPMTFGLLRPSILMPADASTWDQERRRVVLLHELAHVRRADPATHLVARAALTLNWWNPLAWIAWREFLRERERAADDLVLAAGTRPSDYAGHLLDVARSLHPLGITAPAAVSMARASELETRLAAILDAHVNRRPARPLAPALTAILAVVLVAPFAAMRAQEPSRGTPPEVNSTILAARSQKNHELLDRAAAVYASLMKYETAQTLLEQALEIRAATSGEQSASYAEGLVKLGDLAVKRNQPGEAYNFYRKSVALGDRPDVAPALVYLGIYAYGKRDYDAASELLERALHIAPAGPRAGAALTWLAELRTHIGGDTPDASGGPEPLYLRAMAARNPGSPDEATTMELYARFLRAHNREGEAQPLETQARDIRSRQIAGLSQPAASPVALRPGGDVTFPAVVFKKEPAYTAEARAAKYQGTVLLYVEIGADGIAHHVEVQRGIGLGLDENAVLAVSEWRFRPATQNGQPVVSAAKIEVNFRLM